MFKPTSKYEDAVSTPVTSAAPKTMVTDLPEDMISLIEKKLSLQDKAAFAGTSKHFYQLFKPWIRTEKISAFLTYVVQGQQDKVRAMLQQDPQLLLEEGSVTDYSSRVFTKVTAYEYAYWARDIYMFAMFIDFADHMTKQVMLEGIDAIKSVGLNYQQNSIIVKESKHFDLKPLLKALSTFLENCDDWGRLCQWAALAQAREQIWLEQRNVPTHIMNEYCHPNRAFDPLPEFYDDIFPRCLNYYNKVADVTMAIFPLSTNSELRNKFPLLRGSRVGQALAEHPHMIPPSTYKSAVNADFEAISFLEQTRIHYLQEFYTWLTTPEQLPTPSTAI